MTPVAYLTDDEAAGKIGKVIGVIAAVVMPFAAPAIWGAIAGSTAIGASIAGGLTGVFGATAANIIGSAAVGALTNGALAAATGGNIGQAMLSGGLSGGLGGLAHGGMTAAVARTTGATGPITNVAGAGVNAVGGTGPVALSPSAAATAAGAAPNIAIGATVANGASPTIMQSLGSMFTNNPQLVNRLGAAIVNAAVNGGNVQGMEDLVAQQRAELDALKIKDAAAYDERISAAKSVLDLAKRSDPDWLGRIRMADVKGMETNQYRQTMRNIATKQGGGLDFGQRKAYQRSGNLRIARDSALAYNQGHGEGTDRQAQLYGQAAGLFTGPNFQPWEADTNLRLGLQNYRNQADRSNAGQFSDAIFGHPTYQQPTSPETNNEDDNSDPFTGGQTNPWTWG